MQEGEKAIIMTKTNMLPILVFVVAFVCFFFC